MRFFSTDLFRHFYECLGRNEHRTWNNSKMKSPSILLLPIVKIVRVNLFFLFSWIKSYIISIMTMDARLIEPLTKFPVQNLFSWSYLCTHERIHIFNFKKIKYLVPEQVNLGSSDTAVYGGTTTSMNITHQNKFLTIISLFIDFPNYMLKKSSSKLKTERINWMEFFDISQFNCAKNWNNMYATFEVDRWTDRLTWVYRFFIL